jgi:hypothetical protein
MHSTVSLGKNHAAKHGALTTNALAQPCPSCGFDGPHGPGSGAGPHSQRRVWRSCSACLRWLPKPKQEVRV